MRFLSSKNEMINYTNPNDTYSASKFVKFASSLSNDEFSTDMKYIQNAGSVPILVGVLGFVAILFFWFGLLARCCCPCANCTEDPVKFRVNEDDEDNRQKKPIKVPGSTNTIAFYILIVVVLILDQIMFLGNMDVVKGLGTFNDAIRAIINIFNVLYDDAIYLKNDYASVNTYYTNAQTSCTSSQLSQLSPYITTFGDSVDTFYDTTKQTRNTLSDGEDFFSNYYDTFYVYAFYNMWALPVITIIMLVIFKFIETIWGMKFGIFFGSMTYLLLVALGVIWLGFLVIAGDFCLNPSYNTVDSLPSKNDLKSTASYYITCTGSNVLGEDVISASTNIANLQVAINAILANDCPGDSNLLSILSVIDVSLLTLADISSEIVCAPIQTYWFSMINDGVCDQLYMGISYVWISQVSTSFFLLFLLIATSIAYEYVHFEDKIMPEGDNNDKIPHHIPPAHSPPIEANSIEEEKPHHQHHHRKHHEKVEQDLESQESDDHRYHEDHKMKKQRKSVEDDEYVF